MAVSLMMKCDCNVLMIVALWSWCDDKCSDNGDGDVMMIIWL